MSERIIPKPELEEISFEDILGDELEKDEYIPSSLKPQGKPEPVEPDRSKLLESVKQRIKSGYYNSDEVAEDLSSAFAKAFNKAMG
jgi:hypothetical protein